MAAKRKQQPPGAVSRQDRARPRLDQALYDQGLAPSREAARRLVMAGEVLVDGHLANKPGQPVGQGAVLEIKARPRYVSRGGEKLAAALQEFEISPEGWVCADVGASTGGFTDCLLQGGAAKVYAIDVGYGQLAWSLRQDERVVVMERVNARYLNELPEKVALVCMDASFISLKLLIPAARLWLDAGGQMILLVKPQFEAGKSQVGKGGVVRAEETHLAVLRDILTFASDAKMSIRGLMPSPITGPAGNIEFLLWLVEGMDNAGLDIEGMARDALRRAPNSPAA